MMVFPAAWRVEHAESLADGIGGHVWRVRLAGGGAAVAKKMSAAALKEAEFALAWLRQQDGQGAIRLLAVEDEWQLLEDAGDRTALDLLEDEGDEAAVRVAADVMRRLRDHDGDGTGLQTLDARFASLRLAAGREGGLFAEAATRAGRLLKDAPSPRPMHGDFHHENVLHGPRGWLAIDPHGVSGDPAYDAANWLYNPVERADLRTHPARARRVAEILAPATGRPASAILAWGFCHACLSAAWHVEDGDADEAASSLEVAQAIRTTLDDG